LTEAEFCPLHSTALKKLEDSYLKWRLAFGDDLSRDEYLMRLGTLPETGPAVRQMIGYLQTKKPGS